MNMTRRVTVFIGTMGNGGAQRVISLIAPKLAEKGLEVTVLTISNDKPFYSIECPVRHVSIMDNTRTKNVLRNALYIRKYVKLNCDVIVSFLAPFNMLMLVSTLGLKTPIIVADRNDPTRVPTNSVMRILRNILYKRALRIVAQTKRNENYFLNHRCKNVCTIYNPIDIDNQLESAVERKKDELIVTAGRLVKQKNHIMLINSFKRFHDLYRNYKLIIYGEGEERENIEKTISGLNLNDCVFVPGSTSNLFERISCARLFVLTSDYEGMPNALIEAMCLGLPVISTKVSGATDLICNGKNGYLIDCNDEEALYQHFCNMADDYESFKIMGINAMGIRNQLKIDEICEQWYQLINKTQ